MREEPKIDWLPPNDPKPDGCYVTAQVIGGVIVGFVISGIAIVTILSGMFSGAASRAVPSSALWAAVASVVIAVIAAGVLMTVVRQLTRRGRFFVIGLIIGLCLAGLLNGVCFYGGPHMG
jgi:hypothetical protein